ncbi:Vps10 Domain-Containing Receptor Sorcs3, partial [Manis pentadactyla]
AGLPTPAGGGGLRGADPGREAGCGPQDGVTQHFVPSAEPPGRDGIPAGPETRPGEHLARRPALARRGAPEPGRGGRQAAGGAARRARRGRAAAAGARASAGAQVPAAERRGGLPRPAGPGGERLMKKLPLFMKKLLPSSPIDR